MYWAPKPIHKKGDIRTSTKFAFLPTRMSDGSLIWFEDYILIEEYYVFTWIPRAEIPKPRWIIKEKIYKPSKTH